MWFFFYSAAILLLALNTPEVQGTDAPLSRSSSRTLEEIKQSGKLRIGIYYDDPYFSFMDLGTKRLNGFNADIARALAEEIMGDSSKVEFVVIDSERRLDPLKNGKADMVIAELSMTNQRKALVDFSDTYYIALQSVLVDVNSPFQSLKDLSGQTIGAVIGTVDGSVIESALPSSRLIMFSSIESGFQALKERKIQAFCIDDVMLIALKLHPGRMLLDYRFIGEEIAQGAYGVAVNKGSLDLLEAINDALKKIKSDGRWQEIYKRNIGEVTRTDLKFQSTFGACSRNETNTRYINTEAQRHRALVHPYG